MAKNNLIVNYLPPEFRSEDLEKLFATHCPGQIVSCKVVLDKLAGQSMGFGFVKYESEDDAERAVQTLNGFQIGRKVLKVSIAREEKSNVYVAGFPPSWTKVELEALLSQFGTPLESRILVDANGQSRGVGFIRMETNEQASNAVQHLHESTPAGCDKPVQAKLAQYPISGNTKKKQLMQINKMLSADPRFFALAQRALAQRISIAKGVDPSMMMMAGGAMDPSAAFGVASGMGAMGAMGGMGMNLGMSLSMGGYPSMVPQSQQSQQPFGSSSSVLVGSNPAASLLSAYGSSSLASSATAGSSSSSSPIAGQASAAATVSRLAAGLPQHQQQQMYGQMHQQQLQPSQEFQGICLFVYHVAPTVTERDLFALFSPYGQVLSVKNMVDLHTGLQKPFSFINMASQDQAQAAVNALNGFQLHGKFIQVSFKTSRNSQMFK